jgi:enterochelin esterase-like enzyme
MVYTAHRFRSGALSNERDISVHIPESALVSTLLVFLDAELYRARVQAPQIIENLVSGGAIDEPAVVFVSYCTRDVRWIECECHSPFTDFIVDELLPWLMNLHPALKQSTTRVLIGLSYTGLAASWVALERPEAFRSIISQSGSYWWNDSWICRQFEARASASLPSFYIDVGSKETDENVRHKEDVLQKVSQIRGVRDFRNVLAGMGANVTYHEFDGGHDGQCWAKTLPMALKWAAPNHPKDPAA